MTETAALPGQPKRRYTLYTGLLAALMMVALYVALGIWPFGDGTVVTGDLGGLYINFYSHLKRALFGEAGFFYGFDKGLGGSLLGLYAYYYASPYNLLYLLFPVRWFPVAASLVLFAKIVLACVFFRVFIAQKHPKLGWRSVALSLCYGFMAYCFAYAQNPMWHDIIVLLPLICLGIERIAQGKPFTVYAVSLAVAIFSDFYIAFMACIFAVIYFVWVMLLRPAPRSGGNWKQPLLRFGVGSLLAGGVNAALLLPALANINQNKGSLLKFDFSLEPYDSLFRLPERLLWGSFSADDVSGHLPFLYCGILVLVLVCCYFASRRVALREKLISGGVLLVFVLSFWIRGLDYIWHGLKEPIWFPARYSFIFCFFMVVLAARAFALKAAGKRIVLVSAGVLLLVLLVMTVFPISISRSRLFLNEAAVIGYAFLLLIGFMTESRIRNRMASGALAFAVAAELLLNAYFITDKFDQYSLSGYQEFVDKGEGTLAAIRAEDEGDFRVAENYFRSLNDPMLLGYWGISHFASTQDNSAQGVLYNLGYRNYQAGGPYMLAGTSFADSVLGMRYLINDGTHAIPQHWQDAELQAPYSVYKNPCAMPMVFATKPGDVQTAYSDDFVDDMFTYQNDFYTALGGEGLLMEEPERFVLRGKDGGELPLEGTVPVGAQYEVTAGEAGWYYAYFDTEKILMLPIVVNDVYAERYFTLTNAGVVSLGYLEEGQTATVMWEQGEDIQIDVALAARINMEKVEAMAQAAWANSGEFSVKDGYVSGTVHTEAGYTRLYTSIPWDGGWQATVNGEKVQPELFMGGLVSVPLQEGENRVELRYVPPGLYAGVAVTLVCLAGFAAALAAEGFLRRRRALAQTEAAQGAVEEQTEQSDEQGSEQNGDG